MRDLSFLKINLDSHNYYHVSSSCWTLLSSNDQFTLPKSSSPPVLVHVLTCFIYFNLFLSISLMTSRYSKFIASLTCQTFSSSSMPYFEQQKYKSRYHTDITHAEREAFNHNSVSGLLVLSCNILAIRKSSAYPRRFLSLPISSLQCVLCGSL